MSEDVNFKYLVFYLIFLVILLKSRPLNFQLEFRLKEIKGRMLLIISLRFYMKSNWPFISFSRNSDFDLKCRFFCNI